MFYVMTQGEPLQLSGTVAYSYQPQAIHRAEMLFKQTGKKHIVIKVEAVWITSTLADLLEEDREKEA